MFKGLQKYLFSKGQFDKEDTMEGHKSCSLLHNRYFIQAEKNLFTKPRFRTAKIVIFTLVIFLRRFFYICIYMYVYNGSFLATFCSVLLEEMM